MSAPSWLTRCEAELPPGEAWLGPREREVVAGLHAEPRRRSWLLGRYAAKEALASRLGGGDAASIEVLADRSGAPVAWREGAPLPVSLSLSHRAGRALAVVGGRGLALGCDLELIEPRSAAFEREWLADAERAELDRAPAAERARLANLFWSAKEAASKVRRQGLRADPRRSATRLAGGAGEGWAAFRVDGEGGSIAGWWLWEPGWVLTVASYPPAPAPRAAQTSACQSPSSSP